MISPSHSGAYYVRGCAFERMGLIDQSINDFTRVLELDPTHVNAALARGACENKRGDFAKAIEDYDMALQIDRDRARNQSPHRRVDVNYILDMPSGLDPPNPTFGRQTPMQMHVTDSVLQSLNNSAVKTPPRSRPTSN